MSAVKKMQLLGNDLWFTKTNERNNEFYIGNWLEGIRKKIKFRHKMH